MVILLGVFKVATYWLIILSLIHVPLPNCDKWPIRCNLKANFEWFSCSLIAVQQGNMDKWQNNEPISGNFECPYCCFQKSWRCWKSPKKCMLHHCKTFWFISHEIYIVSEWFIDESVSICKAWGAHNKNGVIWLWIDNAISRPPVDDIFIFTTISAPQNTYLYIPLVYRPLYWGATKRMTMFVAGRSVELITCLGGLGKEANAVHQWLGQTLSFFL